MDLDKILHFDENNDEHLIEYEETIDGTLEFIIDKIPQRRYTAYLTFVFGLSNAADSIELMSVSYLIPTSSCSLHMGSLEKGILSAISFFGMMVGSMIGGYMADKYGRRMSLSLTLAINGIGGLISAVQPNYISFIVFRFIAAFGVGGSIPIVWTYFAEFLPSKHRGLFLNLAANSWMIGSVGAAALALLLIPSSTDRGWRYFTAACNVPAFVALAFALSIPESPKYLLMRNRIIEAWDILEFVAIKNKALENIASYKTRFLNTVYKTDESNSPNKKEKFIKIFCTNDKSMREMRKHLIILTITVTLLCYGYYGLLMWMPNMLAVMKMNTSKGLCGRITDSNSTVNEMSHICYPNHRVYVESMLIAASSLPGNIVSTFLIDKVGRKLLLIPCLFICSISVFLMTFIKSHIGAIIFSCLFSAISVIPFNVLNCVGIELFPTRFRANSFSLQYLFGRIGAILATVSFGYFLDVYCYLPLIIVAVNLIIAGILSCGLKETKGLQIY